MRLWGAAVDKLILDQEKLKQKVAELKRQGKRIVFTNGRFELLHVGHIRSLKQARALGDVLLVAVNSDRSIRALKRREPLVPQLERAELLDALECVDIITIFDEPTADDLLLQLRPHVHAKGTDYTYENVPERNTVLSFGGEIAIVGDPKHHSATGLFERIQKMAAPDQAAFS